MCTYAVDPQTWRWDISGLHPCHSLQGVALSSVAVGHRFHTWTNVASASPQNAIARPDSANMAVIRSDSTRLAHSATPFCWGRAQIVCWHSIPHSVVNLSMALLIYSPPLSSQCFDLLLALVLCKCLKLLKGIEYIRFGTNGQNKAKSGIVSHQ